MRAYHWLPVQGLGEDAEHLLQAAVQQHGAQAGLERAVPLGDLVRQDCTRDQVCRCGGGGGGEWEEDKISIIRF